MKAHDVRELSTCVLCGDVGTTDPLVVDFRELVRLAQGAYAHPMCLVRKDAPFCKHYDISSLLRLPIEELDKVRVLQLPESARKMFMRGIAAREAAAKKRERRVRRG
jgi:hypothetical protein